MSEVYEGPVRIKTTNKDGDPLLIKTGPNAGKPWCRVSFKVGEDWIDLPDFKNSAVGMSTAKVAYSVKVDDFGDPVLYNGKPEYNLDAIKATGDVQQAHSSPASVPVGDDAKTRDIRRAVALKAATELTAAMLPHLTDAVSFAYLDRVLADASRIVKWLETGEEPNELDEMMDAAKEKLGTADDEEFGF